MKIHRPVIAPRRDWSIGRYTRGLTQWLRTHVSGYDIVFCDSIREESLAAIEASRSRCCPVIVRSSRWGDNSDTFWWTTSRAAKRCGAIGKMADAVIAKSAACQRGLLAEGFDKRRIHRINGGFAAGPQRSATARQLARQSLAAANGDLVTDSDSRVLLCAANMVRNSGVNSLVNAARHLVAHDPSLRIWFVGDGPHRDTIYDRLRSDGIRAVIAMPGSFSDADDLFAAADLFFQGDDDGLEYWLPAAISAEVPLVVADSVSTRAVVSGGEPDESASIQWFEQGVSAAADQKAVKNAVRKVLDDLPAAMANASLLRRSLVRTFPQVDAVDAYVNIMRDLCGKEVGLQDRSVEATT